MARVGPWEEGNGVSLCRTEPTAGYTGSAFRAWAGKASATTYSLPQCPCLFPVCAWE